MHHDKVVMIIKMLFYLSIFVILTSIYFEHILSVKTFIGTDEAHQRSYMQLYIYMIIIYALYPTG